MKKKLFSLIICIICCVSALCFAANAQAPVLEPDDNARFTVNYKGKPGSFYFLLVLDGMYYEGDERFLTDDSILYVSQKMASEDGIVSFSNFRPKPCEEATVFISGGTIELPEICGYISTVSKSTITVPENSTVHFADGTVKEYENETTVFVPLDEGFIYVNSNYTSHALYVVGADGIAQRITGFDNAVVGINGASMRTKAPQGLRFYSYASNSAKEMEASSNGYEISEYGFIVTAETSHTGLIGGNYSLDMNLVSQGKAMTGVAYQKGGKDKIFENQDDYNRIIFTAVLLGIPENKVGYTTTIAYRPYYIITDGETETVLYGEITKRTVYEVASAIKNENGDNYNSNIEYIDGIIAVVEQ